MTTTYTNGTVAIQKNVIHGWCIFTDEGWWPFDQVDLPTLMILETNLAQPIFPKEARLAVAEEIAKLKRGDDGNPTQDTVRAGRDHKS